MLSTLPSMMREMCLSSCQMMHNKQADFVSRRPRLHCTSDASTTGHIRSAVTNMAFAVSCWQCRAPQPQARGGVATVSHARFGARLSRKHQQRSGKCRESLWNWWKTRHKFILPREPAADSSRRLNCLEGLRRTRRSGKRHSVGLTSQRSLADAVPDLH